jgi:hypothetical protein
LATALQAGWYERLRDKKELREMSEDEEMPELVEVEDVRELIRGWSRIGMRKWHAVEAVHSRIKARRVIVFKGQPACPDSLLAGACTPGNLL